MNKDKQRLEIAKACGWYENTDPAVEAGLDGSRPWSKRIGEIELVSYGPDFGFPDYLNDLNAMNEAEVRMSGGNWVIEYERELISVLEKDGDQPANPFLWMASAAQRAEAFLRTIGKWED